MRASGVTPRNGFRQALPREPGSNRPDQPGHGDGRGARIPRPRLARSMFRAPSPAACDTEDGRLGRAASVAGWKAS